MDLLPVDQRPRGAHRSGPEAGSFLGDVALLFTIVTFGNSLMMLTGLDEPRTGAFAYLHLLGRLGVITIVVGLFSLDEVRGWLTRRRRQARHPEPLDLRDAPRPALETVLRFTLRGGVHGTARAFTALVTATCVVTLALAGLRPPAGGRELYRNLVLLVVALAPVMLVASRRWPHRRSGRG
jgi:hypothetical protein